MLQLQNLQSACTANVYGILIIMAIHSGTAPCSNNREELHEVAPRETCTELTLTFQTLPVGMLLL